MFPTSLLVDATGGVVAIYKGPLSVDRLLEDAKLARERGSDRQSRLPFPGKWYQSPRGE